MADSSTHPAPHRDSVDETSPLLPGDDQAQPAVTSTRGPAEPHAPDPPNQPTTARITIRGAIIASRVLLAASTTSFLLGAVLCVTYLARNDDLKLPWGWANYLRLLGFLSFVCIFLSLVNLVLLTQARRRNETTPPGLGILINTTAHGFLTFFLILITSYFIDGVRWGYGVGNDAFGVLLLLWLAVGFLFGWVIMPGLVIFWLWGLIIWIRYTGPSITWSLPGGQLTVEASIKFHRQEPLRESRESA